MIKEQTLRTFYEKIVKQKIKFDKFSHQQRNQIQPIKQKKSVVINLTDQTFTEDKFIILEKRFNYALTVHTKKYTYQKKTLSAASKITLLTTIVVPTTIINYFDLNQIFFSITLNY